MTATEAVISADGESSWGSNCDFETEKAARAAAHCFFRLGIGRAGPVNQQRWINLVAGTLNRRLGTPGDSQVL